MDETETPSAPSSTIIEHPSEQNAPNQQILPTEPDLPLTEQPTQPAPPPPKPRRQWPINKESGLQTVLGTFEQHMREEGFAVNTVKSFSSDIRLLIQYLGAGQPIGDIDTADLNRFLHWLQHERGVSCSPKTYARRVTTLKVLFNWLHNEGILLFDPSDAVIQVSVTSPLPTLPTTAALEKVTAVAEAWYQGQTIHGQPRKKDSRPHFLIQLILETSMKKSEVVGVVLNHIERDDPLNPQLFVRYKNPRLRYKERKLALTPACLTLLDEYVADYKIEEALFPCTPRNLEYVLRDVGDEAGVEHGLLSFENLRWMSALQDLEMGMEPDLIREKLGLSPVTWRETLSKLERLREHRRLAAEEAVLAETAPEGNQGKEALLPEAEQNG